MAASILYAMADIPRLPPQMQPHSPRSAQSSTVCDSPSPTSSPPSSQRGYVTPSPGNSTHASEASPSLSSATTHSKPPTSVPALDTSAISAQAGSTSRPITPPSSTTLSRRGSIGPEMVGPFVLGPTLGRGQTGKVRLGVHRDTGYKVAIKIVNKRLFREDKKTRQRVEREVAILKLIDHPHVMKLHDVWETRRHLFIVMEHVDGGELFDYILKKGRLPRYQALKFVAQIVQGLEHCHTFSICHRDLKPENILLDSALNVKIADFGMATVMKYGAHLSTSCGSPHYTSPEVVSGGKYDGKLSDVWSVGVVLFALVTAQLPFDHETTIGLLKIVRRGVFKIPDYVDSDIADLIRKMLTVQPERRITMPQIKFHSCFTVSPPIGVRSSDTNSVFIFDSAAPAYGQPWSRNAVTPSFGSRRSSESFSNLMAVNNSGNVTISVHGRDTVYSCAFFPRASYLSHETNLEAGQAPGLKSETDIDSSVLEDLYHLGWGSRADLVAILTSTRPNLEQVFYHLLQKRKSVRVNQLQTLQISSAQPPVPVPQPVPLAVHHRPASSLSLMHVPSSSGTSTPVHGAPRFPVLPPSTLQSTVDRRAGVPPSPMASYTGSGVPSQFGTPVDDEDWETGSVVSVAASVMGAPHGYRPPSLLASFHAIDLPGVDSPPPLLRGASDDFVTRRAPQTGLAPPAKPTSGIDAEMERERLVLKDYVRATAESLLLDSDDTSSVRPAAPPSTQPTNPIPSPTGRSRFKRPSLMLQDNKAQPIILPSESGSATPSNNLVSSVSLSGGNSSNSGSTAFVISSNAIAEIRALADSSAPVVSSAASAVTTDSKPPAASSSSSSSSSSATRSSSTTRSAQIHSRRPSDATSTSVDTKSASRSGDHARPSSSTSLTSSARTPARHPPFRRADTDPVSKSTDTAPAHVDRDKSKRSYSVANARQPERSGTVTESSKSMKRRVPAPAITPPAASRTSSYKTRSHTPTPLSSVFKVPSSSASSSAVGPKHSLSSSSVNRGNNTVPTTPRDDDSDNDSPLPPFPGAVTVPQSLTVSPSGSPRRRGRQESLIDDKENTRRALDTEDSPPDSPLFNGRSVSSGSVSGGSVREIGAYGGNVRPRGQTQIMSASRIYTAAVNAPSAVAAADQARSRPTRLNPAPVGNATSAAGGSDHERHGSGEINWYGFSGGDVSPAISEGPSTPTVRFETPRFHRMKVLSPRRANTTRHYRNASPGGSFSSGGAGTPRSNPSPITPSSKTSWFASIFSYFSPYAQQSRQESGSVSSRGGSNSNTLTMPFASASSSVLPRPDRKPSNASSSTVAPISSDAPSSRSSGSTSTPMTSAQSEKVPPPLQLP